MAEKIIITIDGIVYDLTEFEHPGGYDKLFKFNGKTMTNALFKKIHGMDFPHETLAGYQLE